jgi:hypothetical protein
LRTQAQHLTHVGKRRLREGGVKAQLGKPSQKNQPTWPKLGDTQWPAAMKKTCFEKLDSSKNIQFNAKKFYENIKMLILTI